jgi:adenosylcobinamide kinase/adenosylcobinamide-phosphate guanylyltransferase
LLRDCGALAPGAQLALIGATHDSTRGGRRELLLRAWGLGEAADGQRWALPAHPRTSARHRSVPGVGRVLVIGGSASGKSQLAEDLLAGAGRVTYLATGQPARPEQDADWAQRVRQHQLRRPGTWQTLETQDPATSLRDLDQPLLLDSLGSWLTGVLDRAGAWQQAPGWQAQVDLATQALVRAYASRLGSVVAVTDEVGWGVIPATPAGRLFRDLLGQLNQALAHVSDDVVVVVAGQVMSRAQ